MEKNDKVYYVDPRCADMPVQEGTVLYFYEDGDACVWNEHLGEVDVEPDRMFGTRDEAEAFWQNLAREYGLLDDDDDFDEEAFEREFFG